MERKKTISKLRIGGRHGHLDDKVPSSASGRFRIASISALLYSGRAPAQVATYAPIIAASWSASSLDLFSNSRDVINLARKASPAPTASPRSTSWGSNTTGLEVTCTIGKHTTSLLTLSPQEMIKSIQPVDFLGRTLWILIPFAHHGPQLRQKVWTLWVRKWHRAFQSLIWMRSLRCALPSWTGGLSLNTIAPRSVGNVKESPYRIVS